jgi:cyclic beta-1,2-glucan synthetase
MLLFNPMDYERECVMGLQNSYVGVAKRKLRLLNIALRSRDAIGSRIETLCREANLPVAQLKSDLRRTILHLDELRALPPGAHPHWHQVARILVVASRFLIKTDGDFTAIMFADFVHESGYADLHTREINSIKLSLRVCLFMHLMSVCRTADLLSCDEQGPIPAAVVLDRLKTLDSRAWGGLHGKLNPVETLLSSDPVGIYRQMHSDTKRLYRETVTKHSMFFGCPETTIAASVLNLAQTAAAKLEDPDPRCHVGYYLIGEGQRELFGIISKWQTESTRVTSSSLHKYYSSLKQWLLTLTRAASILVSITISYVFIQQRTRILGSILLPIWACTLLAFLFVRMSSALMIAVFHRCSPPSRLPRMLLPQGSSEESRLLIAMPCLLLTQEQVDRALRNLEHQYLAANDLHAYCAFLTDHDDSSEPIDNNPTAKMLLNYCIMRLKQLNAKYGDEEDANEPFLLLHRHQIYSSRQRRWMGWERKRGKLQELNNLITGWPTKMQIIIGRQATLMHIRHVIIADEDTCFGRSAIRRLLGTMLHPLNTPVLEEQGISLRSGFGILQPACVDVCRCRTNHRQSEHEKESANENSQHRDFDQDVYGRTIFRGKGLYHVAAFTALTRNRLPDDILLSHDSIEGILVPAAFVPAVFEQACNHSFIERSVRNHRWMRGNWQNLFYYVLSRLQINKNVSDHRIFPFQWVLVYKCARGLDDLVLMLSLLTAVFSHSISLIILFTLLILFLEIPRLSQIICNGLHQLRLESLSMVLKTTFLDVLKLQRKISLRFARSGVNAFLALDAIFLSAIRAFVIRNTLDWDTSAKIGQAPHGVTVIDKVTARLGIFSVILLCACALLGGNLVLATCLCAIWLAGGIPTRINA